MKHAEGRTSTLCFSSVRVLQRTKYKAESRINACQMTSYGISAVEPPCSSTESEFVG
jgi:hypothetical protein